MFVSFLTTMGLARLTYKAKQDSDPTPQGDELCCIKDQDEEQKSKENMSKNQVRVNVDSYFEQYM